MEMRQLEYALAVAKHRSFASAAEEIRITPSVLVQYINRLEAELGVCLFLKGNRLVRLTPSGEKFVTGVIGVVSDIKKIKPTVPKDYYDVTGELRLGILAVVGYYNLLNLLSSFQNSFADTRLSIVEGHCEKLLEMLLSNEIDASLVQIYKPDPCLTYFKLVTDKMVVVTNEEHRFASRKYVGIIELKSEEFVLPPPSSGLFFDFNNACKAAGFSPILAKTCYVARNIVSLVREGRVISAISGKVAEAEKADNLSIIDLRPTIPRKIFLAVRNTPDPSPTLKSFLVFAQQWLAEQIALEQVKNTLISTVLKR